MSIPILLAHGSLGYFDELIFLGVAVIFLVMMGISWAKSQRQIEEEASPETPSQDAAPQTNSPDRFKLD